MIPSSSHPPPPPLSMYLGLVLMIATLATLPFTTRGYKVATVAATPDDTSHVLLYRLGHSRMAAVMDEEAIMAVPLRIDGATAYTQNTPFHLSVHDDGGSTSTASVAVPDMDAVMRPLGYALRTSPYVLHWRHSREAELNVISDEALYRQTKYTSMFGVLPFASDLVEWALIVRDFTISGPDTGGATRDKLQYGFEVMALPIGERTYSIGDAAAQDRAVTLLYVVVDADEVERISPDYYASNGKATVRCEWHYPVEPAALTCNFLGVTQTLRLNLSELIDAAVDDPDQRLAAELAASQALFVYRANTPGVPMLIEDGWLDYRNERDAPTDDTLSPGGILTPAIEWRIATLNRAPSTLPLAGVFLGSRITGGHLSQWQSFPLPKDDYRIVNEQNGTIQVRGSTYQVVQQRNEDGFEGSGRIASLEKQADDFVLGGGWPREQLHAFFTRPHYMGPDAVGEVERWLDVVVAFRDDDGQDCQGAKDSDVATTAACRIHIWYRWMTWDQESPMDLVPVDTDASEFSHHVLPFASHNVAQLSMVGLLQEVHETPLLEDDGSASVRPVLWLTVTVTYIPSLELPPQALNILLYPKEDESVILPTFELKDGLSEYRDWSLVSVLHTPSKGAHPLAHLQTMPVINVELEEGPGLDNPPPPSPPPDDEEPNEPNGIDEPGVDDNTQNSAGLRYCPFMSVALLLAVFGCQNLVVS